jgi:hypothetical protein
LFALFKTFISRIQFHIPDKEVLVSEVGHSFWPLYMDHVHAQVALKDSVAKYKEWKIRFVYQTTGPKSLARCIKENNIEYTPLLVARPEDCVVESNPPGLAGLPDYGLPD